MTHRTPGFPDTMFTRGEVPMTKQEVRAAVMAKLAPKPDDILWDVGAGYRSVSIELALSASFGRTYAVEYNEKACDLIRINREKLGAWNLKLIEGAAPQALHELETPDAVFIGGTKGSMEEVVIWCLTGIRMRESVFLRFVLKRCIRRYNRFKTAASNPR